MTSTDNLYEKPIITKLQSGSMNKFENSYNYSIQPRTSIDGVSIDELINQFGSPLFVFSESTIRDSISKYKKCFLDAYSNIEMTWSYKTNYLDAIGSIFFQEGFLAEVVSEMEYEKARRIGIPGDQIIFNGPNKSIKSLERAVKGKAKIHIDNFEEIENLATIANELGSSVDVGIRISLDAGVYPLWSRFGFNLESGEALLAVEKIKSHSNLKLTGLHCHIGTFILEPESYKLQIEKMFSFASILQEKNYFKIEYIDIGGGFPSKSKLKSTYYHPELVVPPIESYAKVITDTLQNIQSSQHGIKVFLENGRALIDEAGFLISTVKSAKRLPDGRKGYILDAGVNLLYTSSWYKFTIELNKSIQKNMEMSLLYGPLCMNIDVIDEGVLLPPLNKGDNLILSPVGAYNVTQWMQFIEYRPPIIMIDTNENPHVIREGEDLTDMVRRENIPEHLAI